MAFTRVQAQGASQLYVGLSTDTRPTAQSVTGLQTGARIYEFDTRRTYTWDGTAWNLKDSQHEDTVTQSQLLDELVILGRLHLEELTKIRLILES